jgi:phosphate-selective porin OprO/OprP
MYRFKSILIGMLSLALIGTIVSCSEQEAEAATLEERVEALESKGQTNWPQLSGVIQYDMGMYSDDLAAANLSDDVQFRRVRLGTEGEIDGWGYKLGVDVSGTAKLKDAYITRTIGELWGMEITTGQHKAPTSIDENTAPENITFMERATPSNISATHFGSRRLGTSAIINIPNVFVQGGIFGNEHDSTATNQWSWNTRGMITVGDGIGIGGSMAQLTDLDGSTDHSITYTDYPESQIDGSKLRTTGAITAREATHMAASAMFTQGPIHAQGEYFIQELDVSDTVERSFSGYYGQAGYFITGENRTWDQRHATWNSIEPIGKWAIEVAGRYSMQDYTDGTAVTGGEQTAMTAAVNMYSGPAKIGLNITQVEHDTANVGDDHTFIGVRTQLSF